jgi:hypothetical protein
MCTLRHCTEVHALWLGQKVARGDPSLLKVQSEVNMAGKSGAALGNPADCSAYLLGIAGSLVIPAGDAGADPSVC